jgi:hypothetical protein
MFGIRGKTGPEWPAMSGCRRARRRLQMGKKKDEREHEGKPRKLKEVCCEKYLKKGRRCKDCPQADQGTGPGLPGTQAKDERR